MEKVPSENLLPQNLNGLAKRLRLPSGGAVISFISAVSHQLGNKEDVGRVLGDVCPLSRPQIYASRRLRDIRPECEDNVCVC